MGMDVGPAVPRMHRADAGGMCQASRCLHCKIFVGQILGQRGTTVQFSQGSLIPQLTPRTMLHQKV